MMAWSRWLTTTVIVMTFSTIVDLAKGNTFCSNPPPGVAKMVRGVDITTLDLVPLVHFNVRGLKNPVVAFTCNQGHIWTSPSGQQYQLPDQIWRMTSVPAGWASVRANLFQSSDDVKRWMGTQVGLGFSTLKYSFSASISYTNMQHTLLNSSKFLQEVSGFVLATRVDLIPDWLLQLDGIVQMYVDRFLNGTFESNRAAYERFVHEFGTHYFSTANFGGLLRMHLQTNKSYKYSRTDEEMKAEARATFLSFVNIHGGVVTGASGASTSFERATSHSVHYYGGETNFFQSDGIQRWQPTVLADPWLFSGQLKPITDLIADEHKKANLIKAVKQHSMRGYLGELLRVVTAAKAKIRHVILNQLKTRIEAMQEAETLVENQVEALSNDVNNELVTPSWFRENTKLCYKWRPDGDGSQCGGAGAARVLCSAPNSKTPYYRDDTNERRGGCSMKWGITSQNFPDWFANVKICFRWYPGARNGQCTGRRGRNCAPLNHYTSEYVDQTDNRSDGCNIAWKIEVPSSAPLWMKTTKICYFWFPDNDPRQCVGSNRTLCATSGRWTDYYTDNTDNRRGGCQMSWGLFVQI